MASISSSSYGSAKIYINGSFVSLASNVNLNDYTSAPVFLKVDYLVRKPSDGSIQRLVQQFDTELKLPSPDIRFRSPMQRHIHLIQRNILKPKNPLRIMICHHNPIHLPYPHL